MNGMRSVSRLSLLLSAAAATAAIAAGVPATGAAARSAAPAGTYVGTLAGTHAFVAVLIGEQGALRAYVYDATHRIAAWTGAWTGPAPGGTRFTAAAGAGRVDVTSSEGASLEATIVRGRVSGSVGFTSSGRHVFKAVRVAPPGRFHEILVSSGGTRYLGGWIMWDPGRAVGYLVPAPVVVMLARNAAG
jgi:hypothetical protein